MSSLNAGSVSRQNEMVETNIKKTDIAASTRPNELDAGFSNVTYMYLIGLLPLCNMTYPDFVFKI